MRRIKLCLPIFFDEGIYPSAGAAEERKLIYWRTMTVLCASIRRAQAPELDILICANDTPPPDILEILYNFGVVFICPDFSFRPPKGLFPNFSGAFYLFDCMNFCRRSFPTDNIFVFIDPDCTVMNNLEVLRHYSNQWPLIGYRLEIEKDVKVNGCSRNDLLAFLTTMTDNSILEAPKYFGGELLVINGEALPDFYDIIVRVWRQNLNNFLSGKDTLKTEEHVISAALALSAKDIGFGGAIIKRMWTRASFRNVSSDDRKFSIWHLPAEKRFAFQQLFSLIESNSEYFISMNDRDFGDFVAKSIRLEPSLIERLVFSTYPLLKMSVNRLMGVVGKTKS